MKPSTNSFITSGVSISQFTKANTGDLSKYIQDLKIEESKLSEVSSVSESESKSCSLESSQWRQESI